MATRELLHKDEVIKAIERTGPSRIPMHRMDYFNGETRKKYGEKLVQLLEEYPEDLVQAHHSGPKWESLSDHDLDESHGYDARVIIEDYSDLDEKIEGIARFGRERDFSDPIRIRAEHPDNYCIGYSWFNLFERTWSLRGMENTLADMYVNPEELHRLMDALADYHTGAIQRFGEFGFDGIATSDDLGSQRNTMFSPEQFNEFFVPRYKRMFDVAHDFGMHVFFHACGHMEPFIEQLIECGVDALHPIQHSFFPGGDSANDAVKVAKTFEGRLTFWAGVDVQYLIPRGTVDEVRAGVRELIDLFDGPNGGMVVASGNGILPETPWENIEALFDEAYTYGRKHREVAARA